MKKYFYSILFIASTVLFSMSAFANNTVDVDGVTLTLSTNVQGMYTASSNQESYIALTYNDKGNGKVYGLTSGGGGIHYTSSTSDFASATTSSTIDGWSLVGE